ncbi:hypothetical protein AB0K53_01110 [Streptomyces tuirus]|uniref:hypothetical protein n=1 Tax=Streptomyces tuirus TaxID=68278 RepID=UPI00344419BA
MTDQKPPDGTQERPEGGSATPAPPDGPNGPHSGGQPRGPVDWARHQAAQWQAGGIPTASTITQQQLDALHADLDELREISATRKRIARRRREQLDQAEATLDAVRTLAAELFVSGATQTERAVGRRILSVLTEPEPHNAGPSVAECAKADRLWPLQKAGE